MQRKFQAGFNGFEVDSDLGLRYRGRLLSLHPKELAVLILLLERAGQLTSKEKLAEVVWHGNPTSDESIARCISVIKTQMREACPGSEALIKTEYGRGYRFIGEISNRISYVCEESFHALIDASPDFIAVKNGAGQWVVLNQSGARLYGLESTPWQNKTDLELAELAPPHCREGFKACVASDEAAWQARAPTHSMESVPLPGGGKRIFEVVKSPLFNEDGSRKSLVIMGRDVTEMLHAAEQNALSSQVLANSREAVVITDANNNILSVNRAFSSVTGYSPEEVIGRNPRLLSSGRHDLAFYREMWRQIELEGAWRGEIWDRRKSGEIYPKWLDISTVRNQEGKLTNYIAIFSDLTERKAAEEQLEFLAYHDPLTRLPNRLLLRDRFELATAAAARDDTLVAMLFLDLDEFKNVNDSLGHATGDQLLLNVTERLANCVRETDTVSRLGGDEFVILLTGLQDVDTVSLVAQKILDSLNDALHVGEHAINTSFSIGIGLFPDDGTDFDTLLKLADAAMYHAKHCGRNTYRFYTEQLNINAMERLQMRNHLHRALKQKEFLLHYQPQFDLRSGRMTGVEALLRWDSGENGLIGPAQFIPIAEESGLIIQIGAWVIHEACRQNRAWQASGHTPFTVAVNMSAVQFRRGNIVETVLHALQETGLEARWLELELTESILIQDAELVLDIIRKLKEIGVRLSIDDFGTGYSSLAYLKRFAVDKLKVDQSFIRNMVIDTDDAAIVHSVIHLGHSLKLKTIAEGVESMEQVAHLKQEGCDEVQGYFYSHPLPAQEVLRFLEKSANINKTTC